MAVELVKCICTVMVNPLSMINAAGVVCAKNSVLMTQLVIIVIKKQVSIMINALVVGAVWDLVTLTP